MNNLTCCLTTAYSHCDEVRSCLRFLKVRTNTISGPIAAYLIDKFFHQYNFAVTTNAQGEAFLDLDMAHLPEGLLNPYAGEFDLVVTGHHFTADGAYYKRLRFNVVQAYAAVGAEPDPLILSSYPTYEFPFTFEAV